MQKSTFSATLVGICIAFFALGSAGPSKAQAQDIAVLIELASNDAAQDILSLPGSELAAILDAASDAERRALLAALSIADQQALILALAEAQADISLLADLIAAAIAADPRIAESFIEAVIAATPPDALPALAEALVAEIGEMLTGIDPVDPLVLEALIRATLEVDSSEGTVYAIVDLAEAATAPNAIAALGEALEAVAQDADPALASAITTAVALSPVASLSESFDASTVSAPAPAEAPQDPVVAAAEIGGEGATSGETSATQGGESQTGTGDTSGSPSTGAPLSGSSGGTAGGTPDGDVSPAQ
jgi:hypothetical protein